MAGSPCLWSKSPFAKKLTFDTVRKVCSQIRIHVPHGTCVRNTTIENGLALVKREEESKGGTNVEKSRFLGPDFYLGPLETSVTKYVKKLF